MSQNIYDKGTRNWVKGNVALKSTKRALCWCFEDKLNTFVQKLTYREPELTQFLHCLESNKICKLTDIKKPPKKKGNKIKLQKTKLHCEHDACVQLMKEFVGIHQEHIKLQNCYVWITDPSNVPNQMSALDRDELIWQLSTLYMYVDIGDETKCQSFEDLDISKVIKLMRNCTKLWPDGIILHLENVLNWRNKLMHSPDLNMDDQNITKMLSDSRELLRFLQNPSRYIDCALDTLQRLLDNDIYIGNLPEEMKEVLKKAGDAKEKVERLYHSDFCGPNLKTGLESVLSLLGDICQTEATPLSFEPRNYKIEVEMFIKSQIQAIDSDLASCDITPSEKTQLKNTRGRIENVQKVLNAETDKETLVQFQIFSHKESMHTIGTRSDREGRDFFKPDDTDRSLFSKCADNDIQQYINGYPDQVNDLKRDENYKFFMNEIPSRPNGDYIDTIHSEWWGDYKRLEENKKYMQWLFPVRAKSCNRKAQELFPHEIKKICDCKEAQDRLFLSYKMMLDFYGLKLENEKDGTIIRSDNWNERFANLNRSNHNHNRITRILKCLGELGFEHLKKNFIKFILVEILEKKTLVNLQESCCNYWIAILKNQNERAEMEVFYQQVTKVQSDE